MTTAYGEPFPPQARREIERIVELLVLVLRRVEAIEAKRAAAVRRAETERDEADRRGGAAAPPGTTQRSQC